MEVATRLGAGPLRAAALGSLVALGALSACASGSHSGSPASGPSRVTVTVTGSSTTSSTTQEAAASPPATTAPGSASSGATFTMPDEVGKVLQAAQDDVQRVTHDPVFYTGSRDATGRGRHQILDRDWKVCSQNVPAGQRVERRTVIITFSVVKLAETCP